MIAQTTDGETLVFRIEGSSQRTPILTAHGLVSSIHHWTFFTPHYAAERAVVSWDYRGHGGQPAPRDREVTVAQFADDACAVWRASRLSPVIVVGLSFGVQVALEIWRRHPEMVRSLILMCGTPGHPLDRLSRAAWLRAAMIGAFRGLGRRRSLAIPILAALRSHMGVRLMCELTYASGGANRETCPAEVLEGVFGHMAALDPELIGNLIAAYLDHTAEDVLPTITVPTLVIAGDHDQLTPIETAERMHRAIPGSELVVFAGHSHLVQVEKPEEVHAAIDAFLRARGL